ncbi:MAG: IS630 family transposase [Candidatus Omnitrophica bacterium]|nr:IS630 family transposase [Candidatus Omnitrophota bacterium]MCK5592098.1 IS630 family transposase [Candidatus Paceibacterota bacterium]
MIKKHFTKEVLVSKKKYIVKLTKLEKEKLQSMISSDKHSAKKLLKARVLLKADQGWIDQKIADSLDITVRTLENMRKQFVEDGFDSFLQGRYSQRTYFRKLDGKKEAQLITIACSESPEGHERWTLKMLANKMVRLEYVDTISPSTVQRGFKKNEIKPWLKKQWCIPPESNAAFVCQMEETLDIYMADYDNKRVLVCMDETSKQQIKETRIPLAMKPGHPEIYDHEYERNGVSNLFMFFSPIEEWRHVEITNQRTKIDWAYAMKELSDKYFKDAEKIVVVMDNLNTHNGSSFYEAFDPEEARRLCQRFEFHYTPKHGSWLNMAETELSILARQCLNRRIPDQATLKREVQAWEKERNQKCATICWRFTTEDARVKLNQLYPKF